jgi:hypothetical protein
MELKSVTTIQDWCGQAFQQLNYRDSTWSAELRSYFEDAGDVDRNLGSAFIEDELWVTLRLDPKRLPLGNVSIIPGAVFTRFMHKPLQAAKASAAISQSDGITTYSLDYPSILISKRPDQRDQQAGNHPANQVERDADLEKVRKFVTARTIDHHVGLIAHGQCESRGRRHRDRH